MIKLAFDTRSVMFETREKPYNRLAALYMRKSKILWQQLQGALWKYYNIIDFEVLWVRDIFLQRT